jgi:2-amino-4-hydroxy-6-hydroxymethyldihydropteridine diphosphokinase
MEIIYWYPNATLLTIAGSVYVIISTQKEVKMPSFNIIPRESKSAHIYLGLGSNLGDRYYNLEWALHALSQKMGMGQVSSIYDTAPVGNTAQPRFLNLVCEATTSLTPTELLDFIKEIETDMGRQRGPPNSPRPIDIDILFYDNQIINIPGLIVPHPRLTERSFVLIPLDEIAPDFVHPVLGKMISKILNGLEVNAGEVVKWENKRGETCIK